MIFQPAGAPQAPPALWGVPRDSTTISRFPAVAALKFMVPSPVHVLSTDWTVSPNAILFHTHANKEHETAANQSAPKEHKQSKSIFPEQLFHAVT
jgi:hypothetical protein